MKYVVFFCLILLSFNCNHQVDKSDKEVKSEMKGWVFLPKKSGNVQPKEQKMVEDYFERFAKKTSFNGVVLVAEKGEIVYHKAFGVKDRKSKEPLKEETMFQLASVSKQFTASAIMLLKQRGKLTYDDYVDKYVKGFPYKVTIRQLLTHRSGLSNYIYFCDKHYKNKKKALKCKDILKIYCIYKPNPYYLPDRTFSYSNTGYVILASIVEIISKKSFAQFMNDEFFEPLKMKNTLVYQYGVDYSKRDLAIGHESRNRKSEINYLDGVAGDKGVYSTAMDLLIWDQSLYDNAILSKSTLSEAFMPGSESKSKSKMNYGFGWRLTENEDGEKIVFHKGWWHGFKSLFFRNIDQQNTVIVLSNVAGNSFLKIEDIEKILTTHQSIAFDSTAKEQEE